MRNTCSVHPHRTSLLFLSSSITLYSANRMVLMLITFERTLVTIHFQSSPKHSKQFKKRIVPDDFVLFTAINQHRVNQHQPRCQLASCSTYTCDFAHASFANIRVKMATIRRRRTFCDAPLCKVIAAGVVRCVVHYVIALCVKRCFDTSRALYFLI